MQPATGTDRAAPAGIRRMVAADVDAALDLLRRGDFGERDGFLQWALPQPGITAFVAETDGRLVGTGIASAHGAVGWVGMIFVTPAWRGSGWGRRLTRAVIDRLEDQGCRSIVLIASPLGRPIYEREGFAVLDDQVRFTIDSIAPGEDDGDSRLRPYTPDDLGSVIDIDRFATGEDRSTVLRPLLRPSTTTVAIGRDGRVGGFLIRPPWRGAAVIAPDPTDALRLLERRRRMPGFSGRTGAGLLASNLRGRALLRAAGWVEELGNVRMVRGDPLDWHPDAIWAQLRGALG
jgi:GNAT superfamily N-acetyltransferase